MEDYRKPCTLGGNVCVAYVVRKIDDHMEHIFGGHSQEPGHLANQGAEGKSKITHRGRKEHGNVEGITRLLGTAAKRKTEAVTVGLSSKPIRQIALPLKARKFLDRLLKQMKMNL